MVSAWIYDTTDTQDPRTPHRLKDVPLTHLNSIGVLSYTFDPSTQLDQVDSLARSRGYVSRDTIEISKHKLPNYDEKLTTFFTEHLHDDEEIRYILNGSGYFDVRDTNDTWIRIHTTKGDLIILPAGIYHRFILDTNNYIHAMRLFKEDPKWTPINRSTDTDTHPSRVSYTTQLKSIKEP